MIRLKIKVTLFLSQVHKCTTESQKQQLHRQVSSYWLLYSKKLVLSLTHTDPMEWKGGNADEVAYSIHLEFKVPTELKKTGLSLRLPNILMKSKIGEKLWCVNKSLTVDKAGLGSRLTMFSWHKKLAPPPAAMVGNSYLHSTVQIDDNQNSRSGLSTPRPNEGVSTDVWVLAWLKAWNTIVCSETESGVQGTFSAHQSDRVLLPLKMLNCNIKDSTGVGIVRQHQGAGWHTMCAWLAKRSVHHGLYVTARRQTKKETVWPHTC